jgi:transcriptional regulator with XRE-family HTH domain
MDDIRSIRQQLGVTQMELADLLGLHQSTISRFEKGSLPLDERTRLALEALVARSKAESAEAA